MRPVRLSLVLVGLGLITAPAFAQQGCPGGHCGQYCPDKKVYPKLEHFYIKKFCGPTIAPGSCFGHFKTQWRSWDDACPGGDCHTPPGVSVYALPPVVAPGEAPPDEKAAPAAPATKPADPKPTTTPKEEGPLPKPTPLPVEPKKDGGRSALRGAPTIRLPASPAIPVQVPAVPPTPVLLPPSGGR